MQDVHPQPSNLRLRPPEQKEFTHLTTTSARPTEAGHSQQQSDWVFLRLHFSSTVRVCFR